jgi:hypothetical protein
MSSETRVNAYLCHEKPYRIDLNCNHSIASKGELNGIASAPCGAKQPTDSNSTNDSDEAQHAGSKAVTGRNSEPRARARASA